MTTYLLLWTIYNPDAYSGHRIEQIQAESLDDAKRQARKFLDSHWMKANWEFRLVEVAHDYGFRLWDTRDSANKTENAYTTRTFWEAA